MTFTTTETQELLPLYRSLRHLTQETISSECAKKLKAVLSEAVASGHLERNLFGLNPIVHDLHTSVPPGKSTCATIRSWPSSCTTQWRAAPSARSR